MHPGAAGCSGCITGRDGERCAAGAAAARAAPGLRLTGHITRLTWQSAAPVAPDASPRNRDGRSPGRQFARHPRGTPPRHRDVDVPGTHRSRGRQTLLAWTTARPGRLVPVIVNMGSSLQAPHSG